MKRDRPLLLHVMDALDRILDYAKDGRDAFFADRKTQDAVVRNFEVMGEAVKRVSDATRSAYPKVPWKKMTGIRDKLIHEYFGVNFTLLWNLVENELGNLREQIREILTVMEQ